MPSEDIAAGPAAFVSESVRTFGPRRPLAAPRPRYTSIQLFESIGNSWYKGVTVGARSRAGGPLEFSAFYTYADAEDDYIDWQPEFQPNDPLDLAAERARHPSRPGTSSSSLASGRPWAARRRGGRGTGRSA